MLYRLNIFLIISHKKQYKMVILRNSGDAVG